PCLLLPAFATRESLSDFGNPRSVREVIAFVSGERFTKQQGAFGFSGWRWTAAARYAAEEYLLGAVPLLMGAWTLLRKHRGAAGLLAGWIVPVLLVTLLFQGEGQFDQWLVFAFIPLSPAVAVGLADLQRRG